MGIEVVGNDQTEITPLQRQVFDAEQARKAEKKQERMEQAQSGGAGGGRKKNQMAGNSPTSSRSETVRYKSGGSREDEDDVLEVI